MKTLVEIPDADLEAAQKFTGASSAEEAVARAVSAFVQERDERRRAVSQLRGSIPDIMTQEELQRLRQEK